MVVGDHPDMDESPNLRDANCQKYQMLVGIHNWIVTLGRLDIAYAVSSLARFLIYPRKGHTERALYVFWYLNKKPNR
eukprot:12691406-Ditylum_brightwellii.AAC.1